MTLPKKIDAITRKIEDLKSQQHKIESDIAQQIVEVIKSQSGFTLPFSAIIGGLLEVIEACKKDQSKSEAWQQAGEKFLKSHQRNNRNNSKNTNRSGINSTPKTVAKSMDGTVDKTIDKAGACSKMKCNALKCLLKTHAQKGVANEKVPSINRTRKRKDSDVEAI